ncbi:obg family GTPase CgtA [Candidatus Phytoplasma oryzae]|uniref:GTPase Obg n=1 Tax=Candidatus Phytoplasma oryzae TaxID=203274 RepID=A0A139JQP8_9MOLU|nr:GTPase ObgE [Candidatus Phytoplasma oryzae]KXT29268.1 obg family GTPase CgtA [Candidatus Phytoplasma oryzae]RAM57852.1 GTPase CgtA [Candidatus Phytoplasma oryzae]
MNFIDKTINFVQAGKGGDGLVAFRREKYVPYGGPYGGNGGDGGSIIFVGDSGVNTLLNLQYRKNIKALDGKNGQNKNKNGAKAPNLYIKVPLGTIVYNNDNNSFIGEILNNNEELIIVKGGKGGRGNYSLANSKNRVPTYAEKGDLGNSCNIKVELKFLADVGMIGFPNVGKSSLISTISNAKSKVGEYPFTTIKPFLGQITFQDNSFIIADIPGLIKDSHLGKGMGINFLKHIERCKVLLHICSAEKENIYEDYCNLNIELKKYNDKILSKPQIIVLNKMDLPQSKKKLFLLKQKLFKKNKIIPISVKKKKNLSFLIKNIIKYLDKYSNSYSNDDSFASKKIFTLKEKPKFVILKDQNGDFTINGEIIEKYFHRTYLDNYESVRKFAFFLKKIGVEEELKKKGATVKSKIRICNYIFELLN